MGRKARANHTSVIESRLVFVQWEFSVEGGDESFSQEFYN